jgi:hypothetical protein
MADVINMVYGALGALIVAVLFFIIGWVWYFPRAGNNWLNRAKIKGTKENNMIKDVGDTIFKSVFEDKERIRELTAQVIENLIHFIPFIIKKDKSGNWVIPDEFKTLIEAMEQLGQKQIVLSMNKFFGSLQKGLSNVKGMGDIDLENLDLSNIPDIDPEMLNKAFGEKMAGKIQLGIQLLPLFKMVQGGGLQGGPGASTVSRGSTVIRR